MAQGYVVGSGSLWKVWNVKPNALTKKLIIEFDKAFAKSQRMGSWKYHKDAVQVAFLQENELEARNILRFAIDENKRFIHGK